MDPTDLLFWELWERVADRIETATDLCRFRQTCRLFRFLGAPSTLRHGRALPYEFFHETYISRRLSQPLNYPRCGVRTIGPRQRASVVARVRFPSEFPSRRVHFCSWDEYVAFRDVHRGEETFKPSEGSILLLTDGGNLDLWVGYGFCDYKAWVGKAFPGRAVHHRHTVDDDREWPTDFERVVVIFTGTYNRKRARRAFPDTLLARLSDVVEPVDMVCACWTLLDRWFAEGRLFSSEFYYPYSRRQEAFRRTLASQGVSGVVAPRRQSKWPHDVTVLRWGVQLEADVENEEPLDPRDELLDARRFYRSVEQSVPTSDRGTRDSMFVLSDVANPRLLHDLEMHGIFYGQTVRWQTVAYCSRHIGLPWTGSPCETGGARCRRTTRPTKMHAYVVLSPDRRVPKDFHALRYAMLKEINVGSRERPAPEPDASTRSLETK